MSEYLGLSQPSAAAMYVEWLVRNQPANQCSVPCGNPGCKTFRGLPKSQHVWGLIVSEHSDFAIKAGWMAAENGAWS